jgi:hypothetical protein
MTGDTIFGRTPNFANLKFDKFLETQFVFGDGIFVFGEDEFGGRCSRRFQE